MTLQRGSAPGRGVRRCRGACAGGGAGARGPVCAGAGAREALLKVTGKLRRRPCWPGSALDNGEALKVLGQSRLCSLKIVFVNLETRKSVFFSAHYVWAECLGSVFPIHFTDSSHYLTGDCKQDLYRGS